jgi:hypothetical protein
MTRSVQSQDDIFQAKKRTGFAAAKSRERSAGIRVVSGFLSRRSWNPMELG